MLQRQVTTAQAIIVLALTALTIALIAALAHLPALPLAGIGGPTAVLAIIVVPCTVFALIGCIATLCDSEGRAAARARAVKDATRYY